MKLLRMVAVCSVLLSIAVVAYQFRARDADELQRPWVEVNLWGDQFSQFQELFKAIAEDDNDFELLNSRPSRLDKAWAELESANRHWHAKRQREAFNNWRRVATVYPDTDAAYASLTNIANVLQAQNEATGAIRSYKKILVMDPPAIHERSMIYANYRHGACCQLSTLYEQQGDLRLAAKYARQAAEQDRISASCGVAAASIQWALEERVKSLQSRMTSSDDRP